MINIEQAILDKSPNFASKPKLVTKPTISLLKRIIYEDKINAFLENNTDT